MENQNPSNPIDSKKELTNLESEPAVIPKSESSNNKEENVTNKSEKASDIKSSGPPISKKPLKPPKLEDKPFNEFITKHLIPGLKSSIEAKGTLVKEIELIEGIRPVVGGNCWMVFCEISEQRKFWLCFCKDIITSDKTILLAESNTEPSIVESFLIDEKKTTLPLLISRVLQRLNGQKWFGEN
tara:strand:- start:26 stop:577 length:552 start_codon:yes stop_codon:yes gene_type:complete